MPCEVREEWRNNAVGLSASVKVPRSVFEVVNALILLLVILPQGKNVAGRSAASNSMSFIVS